MTRKRCPYSRSCKLSGYSDTRNFCKKCVPYLDIFNFDYRPVAKIDTSALPELGSSEEVVSSILEGEDEDSSASQGRSTF